MNVTLPDGTVIQDVPDGTTKAQLLQKLQANNHPAAAQLGHAMAQEQVENDPVSTGARNFAKDMPWWRQAVAGYGKAIPDMVQGLGQMIGLVSDADVDETKKLDAPLMKTGGGITGNIAGTAAAYAPTAFIPGANTIGGAGIIGAAGGAIQPVGRDDATNRWGNAALGAATGPAGLLLGRAIQNPARTVASAKEMGSAIMGAPKSIVEPLYQGGQQDILSRVLNNAAGDNAQGAMANMRNARSLVPGSNPTAGEAANSPGISSLQRTAAAVDPESYTNRAISNNQARVDALQNLAGTTGERDFAAANRSATADDLYKQAYKVGTDIKRNASSGQFLSSGEVAGRKGEITKLLRTPAIAEAVKDAQRLARNEMVNIGDPTNSVQGMDYLKRALDDQIKKAPGGSNEQRILVGLKNRLLTTVDTLSPEYAAARNVFSDMSKPITQMDISQQIADKSIRPLDQTINPNAYAKALSDDTAKSVSGIHGATLENTMAPEQLSTLNAIKDDLARHQFQQNAGRGPGSDTFQKLSMANMMEKTGLPMGLARLPGVGRTIDWLYSRSDNEMRSRLAQILLNPKEAAAVMERQSVKSPVPQNQLTQKWQRPPDNDALVQALRIGATGATPWLTQ